MKLSELIVFMQNVLNDTNKEQTCQDLVRDIITLTKAADGGVDFQYFWCVDRKGTFLTEHGKNAAVFANSAPRFVGTYIIAYTDGCYVIREA